MPKEGFTFFVYSLISLLLGLLGGFWVYSFLANSLSFPTTISFSANPFDAVQILINIILAIYIARILNRKNEVEKVENDLLMKFFTEFNDDFTKSLKSLLFKSDLKLLTITSTLKRFRMRLESLVDLAKTHDFLGEDSITAFKLKEKFSEIKDLLTDTPQRTSGAGSDISVQSGLLNLTSDRKDEVIAVIFEINCLIFKLMVEMNRANRN